MGAVLKKTDVGNIIKRVYKGSMAEEAGIEKGDRLVKINGNEIEDIIDYRYHLTDEYLEIELLRADGEHWIIEIEKEYDDDLGIEFENPIMDEVKSCRNKCVFCFVDQYRLICGQAFTLRMMISGFHFCRGIILP